MTRDAGGAHTRFSRPMLAVIAFLGHAPGLRLLTGRRLTPAVVRANGVAVLLTLAAMAAGYLLGPVHHRALAASIAWLVGHTAWSTVLAAWILRGGALRSRHRAGVSDAP